MITLKEFIMDTFSKHMIEFDDEKVKNMEKEIEKYARKKAAGERSIGIADNEIEQFIVDSKDLLEKLEKETKERKERLEREERERKEAGRKKHEEIVRQREEKERASDSQMYSLFDE